MPLSKEELSKVIWDDIPSTPQLKYAKGINPNEIVWDQPIKEISALPGRRKVEHKISERPSQFEDLRNLITTSPMEQINDPLFKLKAVAVPLSTAFRTLEQPIANAGLALQEGRAPSFEEIKGGVTGTRSGEIGDIFRSVGVPESLSALGGLIATGPLAELTSVGKTSKIIRSGEALAKEGSFRATLPARKLFGKITDSEINKVIDEGIGKGVRPSVAGKNTRYQSQKYFGNARDAVKAIIERKSDLNLIDESGNPSGNIPKNLDQFSQAIEQTKKSFYREWSNLASRRGQEGVTIPTEKFAVNIEKAANNKTLTIRFPELSEKLNNLAGRLREAKFFTPDELDDYVTSLNDSLRAFYKNPNPSQVSQVVADASLANQMRTALDDAIENGFSGLKKKYGALRSIEKDVLNRATVDLRKNYKGFFDLADVVSSGDITHGLLRLDPALITKGVVQRSLVSYFKFLNNPNRIIKNMFSVVDKAYKPAAREITEESAQKALIGPIARRLIEGPKPSKYIGVTDRAGEGFERVMPKEAAARIGARTKEVVDAVSRVKLLPAPMNFEIVPLQEALKRLRDFAFKYYSPKEQKIIIPENITFGTKADTLLKKMGINPITGEIKSKPLKTALQAAKARIKS